MAALVTLEEAKAQIRVRHSEEDVLIERLMNDATDLVLIYLERSANVGGSPVTWDETNVPADVRAAILATVGELWRYRGDAEQVPARGHGLMLSAQAEGYLKMRRPPALA